MADTPSRVSVTLQGTPAELGEQMASALLDKPLASACEQLTPQELEIFCCSYIATTAGLMTRRIGRERMGSIAAALVRVVHEEAQERGPLQ